jgi:hypothetical protein
LGHKTPDVEEIAGRLRRELITALPRFCSLSPARLSSPSLERISSGSSNSPGGVAFIDLHFDLRPVRSQPCFTLVEHRDGLLNIFVYGFFGATLDVPSN